jgi:hypothetical protein
MVCYQRPPCYSEEPELLPCEYDSDDDVEDTCQYEDEEEYSEQSYLPCEEIEVNSDDDEEDYCANQEPEEDWVPPPYLACEERDPKYYARFEAATGTTSTTEEPVESMNTEESMEISATTEIGKRPIEEITPGF